MCCLLIDLHFSLVVAYFVSYRQDEWVACTVRYGFGVVYLVVDLICGWFIVTFILASWLFNIISDRWSACCSSTVIILSLILFGVCLSLLFMVLCP